MRIKTALAAVLLAGPAAAASQPVELPLVTYPQLPAAARDAAGFVPAGWAIVARREGDLNGDRAADLVLVLKMTDPANIVQIPVGEETEPLDTNPHLLLVAFAEAGGYRFAASNRGLFLRREMPFTGDLPPNEDTIRIERGGLVVFFEYLRGWASFRFRWQEGAMRLIGYDDGGVSGGCVTRTSINYLTGRARLEAGYIDQDRNRTASRRLTSFERPTLDRIDLMEFQAEEAVAGEPLWCENPDDE
ncbi:MAG TPA: hypothetical protein VLK25_07750 [Allosphingosinicella sp.]|nr:hypothetical protein [Allosphingosinicella sp.]